MFLIAFGAPGHPATNGWAERYVGIRDTGDFVQTKLDRFFFTYRATPSYRIMKVTLRIT